jgi:hypothetical protein
VAGLGGHGVFDWVHHSLIANPGVPAWWPAFCGAADVGLAGALAVLLLRRRISARTPLVVGLVGAVLLSTPALAQDEDALRRAFEGKRVVIKLEMPGTSTGVDVWPVQDPSVEFPKLAKHLKKHGTAIRAGDEVMVTKVHIKKSHIEFQLGGGGYGTFADGLSGPERSSAVQQGRTSEEKDLKAQIKATRDREKKRDLERRLRDLERQRAADNSRSQAEAAQTNNAAAAAERDLRVAGGSRFNIRWDDGVPADYMTPEGIMEALDAYIDFSSMKGGAQGAPAATGVAALKKGMSVPEVEAALGPAGGIREEEAAGLKITVRTYELPEYQVVAKFASGILADFTISAR